MDRSEQALVLLAGRFESGQEFFRNAAQALALRTGCRWAGIGELTQDGASVELLAFWDSDRLIEPFGFPLAGSPCLEVYRSRPDDPHKFFPREIAERFAEFPMLAEMGARSYRGELFSDSRDRPAGHVFVISDREEDDEPGIREFFRLVAQRVGSEYNRWRTQEALTLSEQSLRWYETMAATTGDRMTLVDTDYKYRAVNDRYMRDAPFRQTVDGTAWTRDRVVGHPISEVLGASLFRETVKPNLARCFAGHDLSLEGWIEGPGDDRRYLQRNFRPVRGEDGTVEGAVVTIRDLTRRRLQRTWISELTVDRAVVEGDVETAASRIVDGLVEHLAVERAGIWLVSASDELCSLSLATRSPQSDAPEAILRLANGPDFLAALESGAAARDTDPRSALRAHRVIAGQLDDLATSSVLDVGIMVSGETIGLIRAEHAGSARIWSADELTFASEAAFLMVQTLLHRDHRLERSIAEQERATSRELSTLVDQRNAEIRERQRLVDELAEKNRELKARNAEIESFTYAISHDLKSPLFTIQGFLGALERDVRDGATENIVRDVTRIRSAAGTMQRLLDALLELSRIGRVVTSAETVSLEEVALEARELLARRLAERGVELVIAEDLPRVVGNRAHLLQMLLNLVENAIKFMGDQSAPRIEIAAQRAEDETVCRVRDNGMGIAQQYQQKIFGLFERLDPESEGTGIGLSIVDRIARAHGGRVWVESRGSGHGSTFWFSLPNHNPAR